MTPEEFNKARTGLGLGILCFVLFHQMGWQVFAGLYFKQGTLWQRMRRIDRQTYSAFLFLLAFLCTAFQWHLSYTWGITFGDTDRGPASVFLLVLAGSWWGICTAQHNIAVVRKIKDAREMEKELRKPVESVVR